MAIPITEFPFEEERIWDVLETSEPMAPIQRRLRQPDRNRRWRLSWRNATLVDKDAIVTEYTTAKGGAGTFSYTPVDEVSAITSRFVSDSLRWRLAAPARYDVSVEIEEVFLGTTT